MSKPVRVVLAAGGTGGHFYPGLAVLEALRARASVTPLFVGTPRGIEARVVPKLGEQLALFDVAPVNGVRGADLARAVAKLPRATIACARALRAFGADVVLSVGGYVAGPAGATALASRVPLAIVEPNAVPGLTNRVLGRAAQRAYLAHEEAARYFARGAARVVGSPVRRAFLERAARASADASGARDARARPHVLVFGGSQGARALNRALPGAVAHARALGADFTVTHQTGPVDRDAVAREYDARGLAAGEAVEVVPFIDDMASAMARADLVVCRAGMGTVSELCVIGRPAVYVPLPTAADDHQRANAEAVARRGAGVVMPQSDVTDASLGSRLHALLADPVGLAAMGDRARALGRPDAADRVAEDLLAMLAAR